MHGKSGHCNDLAANIFNKNLLKKLQIPLFSPSKYLIRMGTCSCQLWVGQLCDLPYYSPTSCRAQRKIHSAWARSNLSNLRSLTILSKETSFVEEYSEHQLHINKAIIWFKPLSQYSTLKKGLRFYYRKNTVNYGPSARVFTCLYCVAVFSHTHYTCRSRDH